MKEGDLVPCCSCSIPTSYWGEPHNVDECLCPKCEEIARSYLHPNKKLAKMIRIDFITSNKKAICGEIKTEEID